MNFGQDHIAESKRRRRIGHAQLKREDQLRSQLGGDPRTALLTGTVAEKQIAVAYYANTGQKDGLRGADLTGVDASKYRLGGFDFTGATLNYAKLGYVSGAKLDHTRSIGLVTAGGDTSGSSWRGAMVIKGNARNSNRRNQNMNGSIVALTDSSGSDSEGLKFHGVGVGNQHGGENLTGAVIGGWNFMCSFNGAHAPGGTITGRADFSDLSRANFTKGIVQITGQNITAHNAMFDEARVSLGEEKNAESANLDQAIIVDDKLAAVVAQGVVQRRAPRMFDELKVMAVPPAHVIRHVPKLRQAGLGL